MVPALEHSQPSKQRDEKCSRSWKNCDFPKRLGQFTESHTWAWCSQVWEKWRKILQTCCTSVSSKDLKRFTSVSAVSQCPRNWSGCEEPRVWVQREPKFRLLLGWSSNTSNRMSVSFPRKGSAERTACCCSRGRCGGRIPSCPNLCELEELCWSVCGCSGCELHFWPTLLFSQFLTEDFLRQGRRCNFSQSCCQSSFFLSEWEFCQQAKLNQMETTAK